MNKAIAGLAAAALLLVGGATSSAAETLTRPTGASKAVIRPIAATPEGAAVLDARVTVKRGGKVVAKNKRTYRAKKGSYRVTSSVTYYVPGHESTLPDTQLTVPVVEADMSFESCTITGRTLANRTAQVTDWSAYWGEGTVRGQVAITYSGDCTAEIASLDYAKHAWVDEWTEIENVWETVPMADPNTFDVDAWLNAQLAANNSVMYPRLVGDLVRYPGNGSELDRAGMATATMPGAVVWVPESARTTVRSTRTVRVR